MTARNRVFSEVLITVVVALLATCGPAAASTVSAETIGKVVSVRGLMSAVHVDGSIDVLGVGDGLRVGDVLVTGDKGYGTIQLTDGSRMTLRPGTRFVLENYLPEPEKPSIELRLLQGGIRGATGWIAKKQKGENFRLMSATAVMGIKGTQFDARVCDSDCSGEVAEGQAVVRPQSATIGRVVQVQGHLAALEPDGRARGLVSGAAVFEGDRLETGSDSFAVVAFQDGSRITLQADSVFFVEDYTYRRDDPASAATSYFRLIRGGLRMLTGAIAKSFPDRFRVATPTAVAGVRGTGFDLNLCQAPCEAPTDQEEAFVGRVVLLDGPMNAERSGMPLRSLKKGDGIYPGDILQTGPNTVAAVVFRDDSRLSLQPGTRFEVSQYHYAGDKEETGVFRLYHGGARMLTGWLAKKTSRFTVFTATAVLGVRGTGFDLLCTGACAADDQSRSQSSGSSDLEELGLVARVWEGVISLTNDSGETLVGTGQVARVTSFRLAPVFLAQAPPILDQLPAPRPDQLTVDLEDLFSGFAPTGTEPPILIISTWDGEVILKTDADHTLSVLSGETFLYAGGPGAPQRIASQPAFILRSPAPRPDRVTVDLDRLFEAMDLSGVEPGFYVAVYDGDVVLYNEFGEVFLGKGEAGFAAFEPGRPVRLAAQPLFMLLDPYPSPGDAGDAQQENQGLSFEDFGWTDIGKETECEIR